MSSFLLPRRINIPLRNLPEFAEAFSCQRNSGMVVEDKCVMWWCENDNPCRTRRATTSYFQSSLWFSCRNCTGSIKPPAKNIWKKRKNTFSLKVSQNCVTVPWYIWTINLFSIYDAIKTELVKTYKLLLTCRSVDVSYINMCTAILSFFSVSNRISSTTHYLPRLN